jgi:uncharacterized protein YidB (DUF937 family)
MGLFDGVLGGVIGAEMATVVNGLIERHGGLQGVVSELQAKGLGGAVQSWIGPGANQPVSADQLHRALGPDTVAQLAAKLSQVLPQAVDKLTPNGMLPPGQQR